VDTLIGTRRPAVSDLTLICGKCRFPIDGDTGYLRVTFAAIHEHRQAEREYRERNPEGSAVSMEEFLLGPEDVHWLAYHGKCEPEKDQDAYQIDAARLRTWQQLCHWTAHLMEKNWFALTDWDRLLREAAGDSEARTLRVLARAS
jgi:hypothetical protein